MKLLLGTFAIFLVFCSLAAHAQDKGFDLGAHAHGSATPAQIGLPVYPGAVPYKDHGDDSDSADMGFTFGSVHFGLRFMQLQSGDSRNKVLDFYRKALSKYGQVLECRDRVPVGPLKTTSTGLTCDDDDKDKNHHGGLNVNGHSDENSYELRAGFPHSFRMVALDDDKQIAHQTRFTILWLELPRDTEKD